MVRIPKDLRQSTPTVLGVGVGDVLGEQFRIDGLLGRGGMGEVYRGFDLELERLVAIKVLPGILLESKRAARALKREALQAIELTHECLGRVYHFGVHQEQPYMVMEFLRGKTLEEILDEREVLPLEEVLPILKGLAAGLDHAHRKKVVHRDIKPSNIMIREEDGSPVLIDFGISAEARDQTTRSTSLDHAETLGTLSYMSPEQVRGRKPRPAMDIYSLGATTYEMLSGHPPFFRGDPLNVRMQILEETPEEIEEVASWVNQALFRCLAKDSRQRFATAMAFWQALNLKKEASGGAVEPGGGEPEKTALELASREAEIPEAGQTQARVVLEALTALASSPPEKETSAPLSGVSSLSGDSEEGERGLESPPESGKEPEDATDLENAGKLEPEVLFIGVEEASEVPPPVGAPSQAPGASPETGEMRSRLVALGLVVAVGVLAYLAVVLTLPLGKEMIGSASRYLDSADYTLIWAFLPCLTLWGGLRYGFGKLYSLARKHTGFVPSWWFSLLLLVAVVLGEILQALKVVHPGLSFRFHHFFIPLLGAFLGLLQAMAQAPSRPSALVLALWALLLRGWLDTIYAVFLWDGPLQEIAHELGRSRDVLPGTFFAVFFLLLYLPITGLMGLSLRIWLPQEARRRACWWVTMSISLTALFGFLAESRGRLGTTIGGPVGLGIALYIHSWLTLWSSGAAILEDSSSEVSPAPRSSWLLGLGFLAVTWTTTLFFFVVALWIGDSLSDAALLSVGPWPLGLVSANILWGFPCFFILFLPLRWLVFRGLRVVQARGFVPPPWFYPLLMAGILVTVGMAMKVGMNAMDIPVSARWLLAGGALLGALRSLERQLWKSGPSLVSLVLWAFCSRVLVDSLASYLLWEAVLGKISETLFFSSETLDVALFSLLLYLCYLPVSMIQGALLRLWVDPPRRSLAAIWLAVSFFFVTGSFVMFVDRYRRQQTDISLYLGLLVAALPHWLAARWAGGAVPMPKQSRIS
jgi:serine/threonine protein kinase